MPQFNQSVEILDDDSNVTIKLDANAASIEVGTTPLPGELLVRDASGNVILRVTAATGELSLGATGTGGVVTLRDAADSEALHLDGDAAAIQLGTTGNEGNLTVRDGASVERVGLDGGAGDIWVKDAAGNLLFHFDSSYAALWLGGQGNEGDLIVRDAANKERVKLDGGEGDIWVKDASGTLLFHFDSSYAALSLGGQGNEGDLIVRDGANKERIKLDGGEGDILVKDAIGNPLFHFDSHYAALYLGGRRPQRATKKRGPVALGNEGDLIVRDAGNKERIKLDGGEGDIWVKSAAGKLLFHFDSTYAALWLGGQGNEGDLIVRDGANKERIKLDGGEGDIWVKDASGNLLFHFDSQFAALYLGGSGNEGDLVVRDEAGNQTIKLDGGQGDIILSNADAAEQFDLAANAEAPPGTVMVLAEGGALTPSSTPYDRKVVGVVAGAGAYRPGIVMDHRESENGTPRVPISIIGKAACRADATLGPIAIGDLLTTSTTPGCAMRVADPARSFGAVIGKALTPLPEGIGFVEVLMTLQ